MTDPRIAAIPPSKIYAGVGEFSAVGWNGEEITLL